MKEFSAQTGGRYTYADDLENLQELALAFSQIFDDCDHFIVSGCEVSGSAISSGYVYLNGKLRYFSGATGLTVWPQYIYENNSTENVPYESGSQKVGRNNFSCAISKSVPVVVDPLTNQVPKFIAVTSTGGLRMKDAFFGKYALLLNPESGSQTVNSAVTFMNAVEANGTLTANEPLVVKSGSLTTKMSYNGSTFTILSTANDNTQYKIEIVDGIGFRFYIAGTLIATIGETIIFNKPVRADKGTFGGLVLTGNQLYQGTSNAADSLYINYQSYNGGATQYRNTFIGNGKSGLIVSISGSTKAVNIFGVTSIQTGVLDGFVLKSNLPKTNNSMLNSIAWKDSENEVIARVGFINTDDQKFYISCPSFDVQITGSNVVNIGPAIAEAGVLLSEKYALQSNVTTALNSKANLNDVYTKVEANTQFAAKSDGLGQFVNGTNTAAVCRQQIGAIGTSELAGYAKLSNCLEDMATSDALKQRIRTAIGAISKDECQAKLTDSGWILIKDSLYARQIGNIVCIQGSTKTVHSGTVFTIPNSIQAPLHSVKYTIAFGNSRSWICKIDANQRACTVVYCDGSCNKSTEFSITYMI